MSDIFSIIVLLALMAGLFKMFGRYIAGIIVFAVLGGIIGAIFTKGLWETFAQWGAVIGFVISFVVSFREAWRTFLGSLIGGLIGAGIAYFLPDSTTMWSTDLVLGLVLIGGAVASSQAAEDLFEETRTSSSHSPIEEEKEPKKWNDAVGNQHDREPVCRCRDCRYYSEVYYEYKCNFHHTEVHAGDYACHNFSL